MMFWFSIAITVSLIIFSKPGSAFELFGVIAGAVLVVKLLIQNS
jgi:hypothetical protein